MCNVCIHKAYYYFTEASESFTTFTELVKTAIHKNILATAVKVVRKKHEKEEEWWTINSDYIGRLHVSLAFFSL